MRTVIETAAYLRDAAAIPLAEEERAAIVDAVAADPSRGERIPGSGGALKRRFALEGRGKSGGLRVIVDYVSDDQPVILLRLYWKARRTDMGQGDVHALRKRKHDRRRT